jgi:hypothetical protein
LQSNAIFTRRQTLSSAYFCSHQFSKNKVFQTTKLMYCCMIFSIVLTDSI